MSTGFASFGVKVLMIEKFGEIILDPMSFECEDGYIPSSQWLLKVQKREEERKRASNRICINTA